MVMGPSVQRGRHSGQNGSVLSSLINLSSDNIYGYRFSPEGEDDKSLSGNGEEDDEQRPGEPTISQWTARRKGGSVLLAHHAKKKMTTKDETKLPSRGDGAASGVPRQRREDDEERTGDDRGRGRQARQ